MPAGVALVAAAASAARVRPAATGAVTILRTNDIHGDLPPFAVDTGDATAQTGDRRRPCQEYPGVGGVWGVARLARAVDAARAAGVVHAPPLGDVTPVR